MRDAHERDELIRSHLPLARNCARRYHRGSEPLEDLEQVASLALVRAAATFDSDRGTAFSSYAVPCMLGAIKRHYRDCGWALHVPRGLKDVATRVEQLARDGPQVLTVAELAELAGITTEEVVEAREAYLGMHTDSLDRACAVAEEGGVFSLLDRLGEEDAALDRACDRVALDTMLSGLDSRDRLLVTLYYREGRTQAQIGKQLGYSQMHISRLLRRAVQRLSLAVAA